MTATTLTNAPGAYRRIEVAPMTPALGAEIRGVDLGGPLDDETIGEIRRALLDHLAVFFRDQKLTPESQKSFGARFGTLNVHPYVGALPGHPEIIEVLKDVDDVRNFGGLWHTDLTFLEKPPLGSVLYALEVPPLGGDTLFANMYAAYEALSPGMRRMLDGLEGVHSAVATYGPAHETGARALGTSMQIGQTEAAREEVVHPLVRTHPETGRKCLFLGGNYIRRFVDMTVAESAPLIDFLKRHVAEAAFTCRFRWQPGSVAFWDNRSTQHYALNDYHGHRRRMHRVTIDGDRPV